MGGVAVRLATVWIPRPLTEAVIAAARQCDRILRRRDARRRVEATLDLSFHGTVWCRCKWHPRHPLRRRAGRVNPLHTRHASTAPRRTGQDGGDLHHIRAMADHAITRPPTLKSIERGPARMRSVVRRTECDRAEMCGQITDCLAAAVLTVIYLVLRIINAQRDSLPRHQRETVIEPDYILPISGRLNAAGGEWTANLSGAIDE